MVALRVSLIISLLTAAAFVTGPANAQFDEAKLQAYIEQTINDRWELIINFQNDQLIKNGQYYQVLPIHSTVPKDGAKALPDKLGIAPTYAPTKTAQAFYDAIKFDAAGEPFTIRIDIYDGPKAQGFVLCTSYLADKVEMRRCWNFGQEAERDDKAWQKIETLDILK
jgi:hypothetical protein